MASDWTEDEVDRVVDVYFSMLTLELAGESYSKTEFRRELMRDVQRSHGSLEFKFQNVSAVLQELGAVYVPGYLPARNVQQLLRKRVTERWESDSDLRQDMLRSVERPVDHNLSELGAPEEPPTIERRDPSRVRRARHTDFVALEASNSSLGRAGEETVVRYERRNLQASGRPDLAQMVRHVSADDGDGLGYDVLSFDAVTASPRYLEVKTTRHSRVLPFYFVGTSWSSRRRQVPPSRFAASSSLGGRRSVNTESMARS